MTDPKIVRRPWLAASDDQGVAFLEVLIAGAIFAIAVIGLTRMLSSGQSFVVAEGDERVAMYLAQQKIEHLRRLGFRCIPVGTSADAVGPQPDCDPGTQQDYNEAPAELGFPRYRRTTVVECVDPQTFAPSATCQDPITAKRIIVTVDPQMPEAEAVTVGSVLTLH